MGAWASSPASYVTICTKRRNKRKCSRGVSFMNNAVPSKNDIFPLSQQCSRAGRPRSHVYARAPMSGAPHHEINVCFVSCPARSFRFVPDHPALHFVGRRPAPSGRVKNRVKIARDCSGGRTKRPTRTDCSAPGGCFAREQLVCHGCLRRSFLPWPADHFPVS